jgi:hypothetical protein
MEMKQLLRSETRYSNPSYHKIIFNAKCGYTNSRNKDVFIQKKHPNKKSQYFLITLPMMQTGIA